MEATIESPAIEKPVESPLQYIERAVYGYLDGRIEDRWSGWRGGIRFTPAGKARVAQIFGWITGLAANEATKPLAEKAAEDIISQLDFLSNYGGMIHDGHRGEKHQYLVEMRDDGTFGGFSLLWYVAIEPERQASIPDNRFKAEFDEPYTYGPKVRYAYSFNGGLLYHGPGCGQTFAVTLGSSRLWSIHT